MISIIEIATYVLLVINIIKIIPSRECYRLSFVNNENQNPIDFENERVQELKDRLDTYINLYSSKSSESEKYWIMAIMLDILNEILCLGEDFRNDLINEILHLLLQNNKLHTDLIDKWTSSLRLEDYQYELSKYIYIYIKTSLWNFINMFFSKSGKVSQNDFLAGLSVVLLLIIVNQAIFNSVPFRGFYFLFILFFYFFSAPILLFTVYNFLHRRANTIGLENGTKNIFLKIIASLTLILFVFISIAFWAQVNIYEPIYLLISLIKIGMVVATIYLINLLSKKSEEDCEQVDNNIFIAFKYIVSALIYLFVVAFASNYFADEIQQNQILLFNLAFLISLLFALFIKILKDKQESNTSLKKAFIVYVFCECLKFYLLINDIDINFFKYLISIVEIATCVVLVLNVIKIIPSRKRYRLSFVNSENQNLIDFENKRVQELEDRLKIYIKLYSSKSPESEKDMIMVVMLDISNEILCFGDVSSGLVDEVLYLLLQNSRLHTGLIGEWTSPLKLADDHYKLSQYIKAFVKDELDK